MTKKKVEAKKQGRTQYSAEFRQQALLRAVKEGVVLARRHVPTLSRQLAFRGLGAAFREPGRQRLAQPFQPLVAV